MELKDLIKDRFVEFAFFRSNVFYYNIIVVNFPDEGVRGLSTKDIYQFPVPLEDIGQATLELRDKAMFFMRWIRKAQEEGTLIKVS